MRTTAVLNLKGGVGKTTTVINMAAILAEGGARVLVIDGDSQCNLTTFLGGNHDNLGTFADMLRIGPDTIRPINTTVEDVDILPADETLMDLDLTKAEEGALKLHALRQFLSNDEGNWYDCDLLDCPPAPDTATTKKYRDSLRTRYDYVLIDCPPAFNAATAAALLASDDVIIPMKLDAFNISGMSVIFRQIENMQRINPNLMVAGILPTMYYRGDHNATALEEIRKAHLPLLHPIRRSDTVDRMTYKQEPLTKCSTRSGALRDYRMAVEEYWAKGELLYD